MDHYSVSDTVSHSEAVRLLADGQVSGTRGAPGYEAYVLWSRRLKVAVRDGRVTDIGSGRRYSRRRYFRAQLEAEKSRWASAGVSDRAARRGARRVRAQALDAEGLVGTAEAARIAGVKRATARDRWGPQGRYGARKVGGQWFFERALVEARDRAAPGRTEERKCAGIGCSRRVRRTASQRRRNESAYCPECWTRVKPTFLATVLAEMEQTDPDELFRRRSEAQRRSWTNGSRERNSLAEIVRSAGGGDRLREHHRKPTSTVKRINRMMRTRFGYGLTTQRKRELERRARARAQAVTERSTEALGIRGGVAALWSAGKTVREIAAALGTSESNVKQIRRRDNLPERPRGRRPRE